MRGSRGGMRGTRRVAGQIQAAQSVAGRHGAFTSPTGERKSSRNEEKKIINKKSVNKNREQEKVAYNTKARAARGSWLMSALLPAGTAVGRP